MGDVYEKARRLYGPNKNQQGHKLEYDCRRRFNKCTDCWVGLARPRAERGVGRVRVTVMMRRMRLFRMNEEAPGRAECERHIKGDHPHRKRGDEPFHLVPSSSCCISATAS